VIILIVSSKREGKDTPSAPKANVTKALFTSIFQYCIVKIFIETNK